MQKALQQKRQKVYITQNIVMCYVLATPQPSIQSDPIPSEVSGSTDSTLEQVAIVSELIDLVAAIGLSVDVHKCKPHNVLHCVTLAHRALADVEAMEKLVTSPPLVECLSSLKSHHSKKELGHWQFQKGQSRGQPDLSASLVIQALLSAGQAFRRTWTELPFPLPTKE